jgi:hypothetical protein
MTDAGIGRVLIASVHQAIADILPSRLEFYENWLNPEGLRNGKIGLAPLAAVLSFLRREGDAYGLIAARAGEYAAEWTFAATSRLHRSLLRRLPARMRARSAVKLLRRLIHQTYGGSRATAKLGRGGGSLEIRGSIFCGVRQPVPEPLCGFFASAIVRLLALHRVEARARVTACRAVAESSPPRPGARGSNAPACRVAFVMVERVEEGAHAAEPSSPA